MRRRINCARCAHKRTTKVDGNNGFPTKFRFSITMSHATFNLCHDSRKSSGGGSRLVPGSLRPTKFDQFPGRRLKSDWLIGYGIIGILPPGESSYLSSSSYTECPGATIIDDLLSSTIVTIHTECCIPCTYPSGERPSWNGCSKISRVPTPCGCRPRKSFSFSLADTPFSTYFTIVFQ